MTVSPADRPGIVNDIGQKLRKSYQNGEQNKYSCDSVNDRHSSVLHGRNVCCLPTAVPRRSFSVTLLHRHWFNRNLCLRHVSRSPCALVYESREKCNLIGFRWNFPDTFQIAEDVNSGNRHFGFSETGFVT